VSCRSDSRLETYAGARAVITGGLGLIGAAVARRLVVLGAEVLLVDSIIPEYGGNLADIRDRVTVTPASAPPPRYMRTAPVPDTSIRALKEPTRAGSRYAFTELPDIRLKPYRLRRFPLHDRLQGQLIHH
jgi:hypothetical protein